MSMDELRGLVDDDSDESESLPPSVEQAEQSQRQRRSKQRFLGLTAGQRAFLAVLIFFIVVINGFALLALTGRIG